MSAARTGEAARLDDAARAGWLYYVAGRTQDEIAQTLGISRQAAQRLVAMAVSERLVKVRIDHPIGRCMDLGRQLRDRFGLALAEVAPSDPSAPDLLTGAAIIAAGELERVLRAPDQRIIALGTGRALKATVEQLSAMSSPQHCIVSRLGNMMADGEATPYNATIRMADRVGARHFPFPLPVLAQDEAELRVLHALAPIRNTLALCAQADCTLVGIGQLEARAPLVVDGFLTAADAEDLVARGAVGEITSWVYARDGTLIDCAHNRRVASAALDCQGERPMIAVALGAAKVPAIHAALVGRRVTGLVTDEATAGRVLALAGA